MVKFSVYLNGHVFVMVPSVKTVNMYPVYQVSLIILLYNKYMLINKICFLSYILAQKKKCCLEIHILYMHMKKVKICTGTSFAIMYANLKRLFVNYCIVKANPIFSNIIQFITNPMF